MLRAIDLECQNYLHKNSILQKELAECSEDAQPYRKYNVLFEKLVRLNQSQEK